MNIKNKLKNLESKVNDTLDRHFVAALLMTGALSISLAIYAKNELYKYEHPKFCQEYCWLKNEPREVQVEYANKINKVGKFYWGIAEYIKEEGARLWLKELDSCDCNKYGQTKKE